MSVRPYICNGIYRMSYQTIVIKQAVNLLHCFQFRYIEGTNNNRGGNVQSTFNSFIARLIRQQSEISGEIPLALIKVLQFIMSVNYAWRRRWNFCLNMIDIRCYMNLWGVAVPELDSHPDRNKGPYHAPCTCPQTNPIDH